MQRRFADGLSLSIWDREHCLRLLLKIEARFLRWMLEACNGVRALRVLHATEDAQPQPQMLELLRQTVRSYRQLATSCAVIPQPRE